MDIRKARAVHAKTKQEMRQRDARGKAGPTNITCVVNAASCQIHVRESRMIYVCLKHCNSACAHLEGQWFCAHS